MSPSEVATLLAAAGALVVSLAGAFVSVWNAVHISKVHTLVNGASVRLESMSKQAGFAEGVAAEQHRRSTD